MFDIQIMVYKTTDNGCIAHAQQVHWSTICTNKRWLTCEYNQFMNLYMKSQNLPSWQPRHTTKLTIIAGSYVLNLFHCLTVDCYISECWTIDPQLEKKDFKHLVCDSQYGNVSFPSKPFRVGERGEIGS